MNRRSLWESVLLQCLVVADLQEIFLQALYKGCDDLGFGDLVRPDGANNIASYLPSVNDDPRCGTRVPDLGPKLYIARPCVRRQEGENVFKGRTYTRLHCDLSDAVNYSYGEGEAIWTIFAAEDRSSKLFFGRISSV